MVVLAIDDQHGVFLGSRLRERGRDRDTEAHDADNRVEGEQQTAREERVRQTSEERREHWMVSLEKEPREPLPGQSDECTVVGRPRRKQLPRPSGRAVSLLEAENLLPPPGSNH